ncbi:MAG: T9SS type A sorting domain-containing protein [Candidatus Eisenbacteria bacterium]|nr:T9SS type A sorting domain-containing protein [Candidatus Eisenbacteria bacterium]
MRPHIAAAVTVFLLFAAATAGAQVNGHVQTFDGKPVLTVWGTHSERGHAAGYLTGEEGKEVFEDYFIGYCCGGSGAVYSFLRTQYENNYAADAKYEDEAQGIISGMADASVDLYVATLGRDMDATDILVANCIVDLSGRMAADPFACSSMSSWGSSTLADPVLAGHLVLTRLLDWSRHSTLTDNPLLTVHFPSEADEQPWLSVGYAGLFGALSAVSESGVSAFLNMGNNSSGSGGAPYHPILLSVRNGIETTDYDGDGEHTPADVTAAVADRARNIDTIVHVTKDEGQNSRPIIIESNNAAGVAVRDQTDNTQVPGEHLAATNHFRVLYSPVSCNRYSAIVDSLTASTEMSCERCWSVMAGAAGGPSNIQCIQYVESRDLLLWSMDSYSQPAYALEPTEFDVGDLFGCQMGVEEPQGVASLRQNRPNPFGPVTRIEFALPAPSECRLAVYDIRGRRVATLIDGRVGPGLTRVEWDGSTDGSERVASGIYLYRLETDAGEATRKMLLLR